MKIIAELFGAVLFAAGIISLTPVAEAAQANILAPSAPPSTGPSEAAPLPSPSLSPRNDIGFLTAGSLAERCQDGAYANINYCFAYIASVHDTMRAYEIWLGQKEFCVPGENRQGDLRRAFLTYLSAYPQNANGQAASVVVVALKQTYPCLDISPSNGMSPAPNSPSPSATPK